MQQIASVPFQIEASNALTVTSHAPKQRTQRLLADLTYLAEARQASISKETLKVYLSIFDKHATEDLSVGIRELAGESRPQFGSAFPTVGEIIERAKRAYNLRVSPPKFVACGSSLCFNGMSYVDADGNPCDVSASPSRQMGPCKCKRAWVAERQRRALQEVA